MIIEVYKDIQNLHMQGFLRPLLKDKSSKKNILWATDAYVDALGNAYAKESEITEHLITGVHSGVIKTRARKQIEQQKMLTRKHAEVFTPSWVVAMMNNAADEDWFESEIVPSDASHAQNETNKTKEAYPIAPAGTMLKAGREWRDYVAERRLEITCGEAPYITSRYDAETGEVIPLKQRTGFLDRKFALIRKFAEDEADFFDQTYTALQSCFGYEFQGDNLLIARVNVLMSFLEHVQAHIGRVPADEEMQQAIRIIVWNVWQMDGLTGYVPYATLPKPKDNRLSLFDMFDEAGNVKENFDSNDDDDKNIAACRIYNWHTQKSMEFNAIADKGRAMKFDFIVGNPPYQDNSKGENKNYTPPLYPDFLDSSYKLSDKVCLIHPARFLFNAGATKKYWNAKMLSDKHLKVLLFEAQSSKIFPNTDIKGGIAVTYRDSHRDFGAIGLFLPYDELRSIKEKVPADESFSNIVVSSYAYHFSEELHVENPNIKEKMSGGHKYDLKSNVFDKLQEIFFSSPPDESKYVRILGLSNKERVFRWIKRKYITEVSNFDSWKVFLPDANGSGALGEVLSTPLIGEPLIGHTETFLSIGSFDARDEAEACMKYIKTKFARVLLGILKVTQSNPPEKWKYVPIQDFTSESDIDWSQSIADIDKQLYKKYGLNDEEINFIETNVREMI